MSAQRSFRGGRDLIAMQRLASRLWPLGFHPGGLGWSVSTGQFGDEIAIFGDGEDVLGFAAIGQPDTLLAQADPACPEVARAIVAWSLEHAEGSELAVDVVDDDVAMRRAARRRTDASTPTPADGYVVRSVDESEFTARAQAHRAAWKPSSLPWHPDHLPPTDPGATSLFTEAVYERVRRTWLYDTGFDLVAVAPDGTFAACCIVWFDAATATAEIEPLGVHPEHRRRRLAGALCGEAVRRVAAAGGREVIINNGPNLAYPAPAGAYAKAGFETVDRGRRYVGRRRWS